jgi:transposase
MLNVPAGVRVYMALGATDMRKGAASLSALAQEAIKQNPFSGHLFRPSVPVPGQAGRPDQNSLVGRRGPVPVRQTAGERPVRLAPGAGRLRHADPGSTFDVARLSMLMPLLVRLIDSEIEPVDAVIPEFSNRLDYIRCIRK